MDDQATTGTRGGMKYRKLRIAWSVGWGGVAVFLCVLWVSSYHWKNSLYVQSPTTHTQVCSLFGKLTFLIADESSNPKESDWGISNRPAYDFLGAPERLWPSVERPQYSLLGFATKSSPVFMSTIIAVPYWFPTLTIAAVAAGPWVRLSKRFSLRTLLIAMTLVAVVLGIAVYATRK